MNSQGLAADAILRCLSKVIRHAWSRYARL